MPLHFTIGFLCSRSTASTKRRYQLEMHELHKKGEKKEASAMAKLLAAEEALSTSLWWSLPQKKKIKGRYAVTEMLEIDC